MATSSSLCQCLSCWCRCFGSKADDGMPQQKQPEANPDSQNSKQSSSKTSIAASLRSLRPPSLRSINSRNRLSNMLPPPWFQPFLLEFKSVFPQILHLGLTRNSDNDQEFPQIILALQFDDSFNLVENSNNELIENALALNRVAHLFVSALQVQQSLGQEDQVCKLMHVHGNNGVLSMYQSRDLLIVFVTQMSVEMLNSFDFKQADQEIQRIMEILHPRVYQLCKSAPDPSRFNRGTLSSVPSMPSGTIPSSTMVSHSSDTRAREE